MDRRQTPAFLGYNRGNEKKECNERRLDFSRLVLSAEATGAEVHVFDLPVDRYCGRVDIGSPAAVGPAFGMADIMAEHRCFTADITLQLCTPSEREELLHKLLLHSNIMRRDWQEVHPWWITGAF